MVATAGQQPLRVPPNSREECPSQAVAATVGQQPLLEGLAVATEHPLPVHWAALFAAAGPLLEQALAVEFLQYPRPLMLELSAALQGYTQVARVRQPVVQQEAAPLRLDTQEVPRPAAEHQAGPQLLEVNLAVLSEAAMRLAVPLVAANR